MPTTSKLIIVLMLIGLAIYGIMFFLVLWVKPVVTELTVDIPESRIELRPWPEVGETPPPASAAVQKPAPATPKKDKGK